MRPTHTRPQRTDDPWGRYAYATNNSNPGSVSPISALANLDLTPGPYTDTMEKSRHEPEMSINSARFIFGAMLLAGFFILGRLIAMGMQ